ncbi:MAG: DUF2258 domain-containing protein [Desulfurococcales archaeon]|jgi:hypothetical protein|nr:DUF2258 domain-containing protein [Desulfurococcales archaeon]
MSQETSEKLLSTGYIWAATYADKIRRTVYAQLKDLLKENKALKDNVPRDIAQLNSTLYKLLVEDLKLEKTDLVRIRITYTIKDNKIEWNPESLTVEAFRRISEEEIKRHLDKLKSEWKERLTTGLVYKPELIGVTEDEDQVYVLKLNGNEYGALILTPLNEEIFIKRGALIYPTPIIFEKIRLKIAGKKIEEALTEILRTPENIKTISPTAVINYVSESEALKIVNTLRGRAKAPPIEKPTVEIEEEIEEEK